MIVYLVTTGLISPMTDSVHKTLDSAKARRAGIIQKDLTYYKYKLTVNWYPKIKTMEDLYKEESKYTNIERKFVYGSDK